MLISNAYGWRMGNMREITSEFRKGRTLTGNEVPGPNHDIILILDRYGESETGRASTLHAQRQVDGRPRCV